MLYVDFIVIFVFDNCELSHDLNYKMVPNLLIDYENKCYSQLQ